MKKILIAPLFALIAISAFLLQSIPKARGQAAYVAALASFQPNSSLPSASLASDRQELVPVSQESLKQVEVFADEIAQLLHRERFAELDDLASKFRASKERYNGGVWKLYTLYYGIDNPWPGRNATDEDWQGHIRLLEKWIQQRPTSITPRVALAQAYVHYAWMARGEGYADKVSDSGWRLFRDRIAEAKNILVDAAKLQEKCPHWFYSMQKVAEGQAWNRKDEKDLFEHAIAFEPEYLYFYRLHANFVLPKWYGKEGDTVAFADEVANRLGGDLGVIVYFDLAYSLSCHCAQEVELSKLSWARIKTGFDALEKRYGPNAHRLNQLAYMAVKVLDPPTAKAAITRLGGNWDPDVWRSKAFYDSSKQWAEGAAVYEAKTREMKDDVEANLRAAGGPAYFKKVEAALGPTLADCEKQSTDRSEFTLYLRLQNDGKVGSFMVEPGATLGVCMMLAVRSSSFLPPPHDQYWLKVDFAPAKH